MATDRPRAARSPAAGEGAPRRAPTGGLDPMLFAVARASTYTGTRLLTAATGFFYERGTRLFFVTSRHVLVDVPTAHHPDRIELLLHTDPVDLTRHTKVSLDLFRAGKSLWRQGEDSGGEIDVAVLEVDRAALRGVVLQPFTPAHLDVAQVNVPLGGQLLVVGFPLGFYDTLHNLPVARHAALASAFGVRFQGQGYFLTDARMHRGASGAPVVMRAPAVDGMPWKLLGIHSARLDMRTREEGVDDTLGLNCAWYADILGILTQ